MGEYFLLAVLFPPYTSGVCLQTILPYIFLNLPEWNFEEVLEIASELKNIFVAILKNTANLNMASTEYSVCIVIVPHSNYRGTVVCLIQVNRDVYTRTSV